MAKEIKISVEPLLLTSGTVVCAINPGDAYAKNYVNGGIIILPEGEEYELKFKLNASAGVADWHAQPFRSRKNGCPTTQQLNGQTTLPPAPVDSVTKTLHVHAKPKVTPQVPQNSVHYALNFVDDNGQQCACDPIIINGISPPPPPPAPPPPGKKGP